MDASRARGLVAGRQLALVARAGEVWADWRGSLLLAAQALIVTRLVLWTAAIAAVELAGISRRAADFDPAGLTRPYGHLGDLLLAPVARWDSVWYLSIAHDGYADATRTAFFPLYPLLARGIVGGVLLSLVATLLGLAALHKLGRLELGEPAARAAVWLLACFPVSFFLTAVYSEGLFLALSVGAFLAARRERWLGAALLGGLAAATRSAGVVLVLPLAMLWWTQPDRDAASGPRKRRLRDGALLTLVPAGLAAYCIGLALTGHDGLAPFDAQEVWFREFAGPFVGAWDGTVAAFEGARQLLSGSRTPVYFAEAGGDPFVNAAHNLELFVALVAVVPALIGTFRRLPPAYGAYALAALALPLSWPVAPQPLMSLPRFELALFPLFLWLGWWAARGRRRLPVLAVSMLGLQAFAVAEFATWHWVA